MSARSNTVVPKSDCHFSAHFSARGHAAVTRRAFVAGAAASLLALALGGCGGGTDTASGGSGTRVLTDSVGREVQVPDAPERIAALDSFAGELAVMAGAGTRIVAVPGGVKSDVLLQELYPGLSELPAPMQNSAINMEELMACAPQVVLVKQEVYETKGQQALLDKAGLPYVVVGYDSMEGQIAAMELVGAACGGEAEEKVAALAQYYRDTLADVRERAQGIPESDRVRVYHAINALVSTDGATSLGADWVEAVGCVDVSAHDEDATSATDYTASLEQIYDWDPDVFVCNSAETTDYLLSQDNCAGLSAVKAKRCHTIPVGATRWGQRGSVETYLAMLWLGTTVYPQAYGDVDLQGRVSDYYRDYLGIEVDDALWEQMLSGEGLRQQSGQAGA